MDLGPIKYKGPRPRHVIPLGFTEVEPELGTCASGIKFTDVQFDRYHREKACGASGRLGAFVGCQGSSFYFLELPLSLGLALEEVEVDGVGTVIQAEGHRVGRSLVQRPRRLWTVAARKRTAASVAWSF